MQKISDLEKNSFRNKFNIPIDQPIIGMAGRLATEKGMEVLVDAFSSYSKRIP